MTASASPPDPPEDAPTSAPRRPAAGPTGVTRTELVWPGKYDEQGRLNTPPRVRLPFQTIETVGESRSTREARKSRAPSLFEVYRGSQGETFEDGWKNKLIWGDNLLVMQSLLDEFAGKIDLIYMDPPFATGTDFSFDALVGDIEDVAHKEQSVLEEKAYRDTWGKGFDSYLEMMSVRLRALWDLLAQHGTIYLHCDPTANHYLRSLMDDTFGPHNFRNELVWHYGKMANATKNFPMNHDTILRYTKSDTFLFSPVHAEDSEYRKRFERHLTGNRLLYGSVKSSKDKLISGRVKKRSEELGRGLTDSDVLFDFDEERKVQSDVIYCSIIKGNSRENLGYPTQKPIRLLKTIIQASSRPGDLVLDPFCGSGTAAAVSEELGRRWIACDLGRYPIHVARKRLLDIENCRPFTLLNLGKYERQHWQGVTFRGDSRKKDATRAYYEYLAFVLKLYGAAPIPGMDLLHGRKGPALVHVGPVDAPVTIADVEGALNECARARQKELHVLAWEWEMGLQSGTELKSGSLIQQIAKRLGVNKLRLLQIPREVMEQQAADKGDVQFFELAYLEAKIEAGARPREQRVSLTDFVVPNWDSVPEDVRDKITKWSDWIDYWAVDWDFRHDSFMQGFVAYRTRKERKLDLVSDPHRYEEAGRYRVLVKVVDIFGNDTSRAWDIKVP